MTSTAELVRDGAAQLAAYHPRLRHLITEQSTPGPSGAIAPRHTDPPFPGNAPAFAALMVITEAIPRLEASLRLIIAGHTGQRRGGSARNFLDALDAITGLAPGLPDEDDMAAAARILEQLLNVVRAIPDIDEAERWRPLPSRACPYCGCWFLKVLLGATGQPDGRVECFGHAETGEPCRAAWPSLLKVAADLDAA